MGAIGSDFWVWSINNFDTVRDRIDGFIFFFWVFDEEDKSGEICCEIYNGLVLWNLSPVCVTKCSCDFDPLLHSKLWTNNCLLEKGEESWFCLGFAMLWSCVLYFYGWSNQSYLATMSVQNLTSAVILLFLLFTVSPAKS